MKSSTRLMWAEQDRHTGDRLRLFSAVSGAVEASRVLYPGSFVDVAPSFIFDSVTYVDSNRRAIKFFADATGVDEIIAEQRQAASNASWQFLNADYTGELSVALGSVDLLISLYAGFVSEHCTLYLAPGGFLLVNASHGDAAMASLDKRYKLVAVVKSRSGQYAVDDGNIETYLEPKRDVTVTRDLLHRTGKGIAYTKTPFAYMFQRQID